MTRQTHEIAVATDAAVEVVRERVEAMREADEAAAIVLAQFQSRAA